MVCKYCDPERKRIVKVKVKKPRVHKPKIVKPENVKIRSLTVNKPKTISKPKIKSMSNIKSNNLVKKHYAKVLAGVIGAGVGIGGKTYYDYLKNNPNVEIKQENNPQTAWQKFMSKFAKKENTPNVEIKQEK